MAVETLELQVNVTGVSQGASQLDRLTKSAQQTVNVLGFLRNALVLASAARLFSGFFELIDSFQRMQQQLQLVTGSLEDTQAAMQAVFQIAQDSRAPLDATNTLFQRLVRVGGNLGYTYGQVATVTKAVAQSFTIAGASAEETRNAIVQLTQGLNLGVLRGQDLRSVVEFNPVIAQAFADKLYSLGLSTDAYGNKIKLAAGQVYSFVTAHKNVLTTKIALDAITESAAKWNEQIQQTPPTLGQLFTNAKNAFTYIIGTLGQMSGLFQGLNTLLIAVNNNLGSIIGVALAVGAAFATWLVLDLITSQFAKLFAFRGLFAFILQPILNIGRAFVNLYVTLSAVVGVLFTVVNGLVYGAQAAFAFAASLVRVVATGASEWLLAVNRGILAVIGVLVRLPGFFALIAENAGELVVLLGKDLVAAAGSLSAALIGGLGSAAISTLAALPALFVTLIALSPVLLAALAGITAAFGGIVSLGEGLNGVGDSISNLASKTASWHDILNSLIKFALVAFDVLANHLPLVFAVIGEQWNNFVAATLSLLPKMAEGIANYIIRPLETVLDIIKFIAPVAGALAGSFAGPVGAVAGAIAGGGLGVGIELLESKINAQFNDIGARAAQAAADAGKKTGHAYTDELTRVLQEDLAKYGKGDFLKAMNLLGKGVDLKTIAGQTGVAIGDLSKVQSLQSFFGKTVPQKGQLGDVGGIDKTAQKRLQDIAAIQNFVKQVEPYTAGLAKMAEADKLFNKAKNDGVNVDKVLAESGLTRIELLKRLAREVVGVGNDETDFAGRVRLLDEALKKSNITVQEYGEQWNKARIKFLSAQTDLASGVELAVRKTTETLSNQQAIAAETVQGALSQQVALAKLVVQVDALREAYSRGILTTKQFSESLRDVQIAALNTQTDLSSGFERGLLKLQKEFSDTASAAEEVMTNAFHGISDQLTQLLTTGTVDLKSFSQSVFKSFANVLSREAVGSLLNSITDNGTNGNVLGKVANELGFGGQLGSSPGNPMYVQLAQSNVLGNTTDLLHDAFNTGGETISKSIQDGMAQGGNSFSDVLSRLFGGNSTPLGQIFGGNGGGGGGFLSGLFGGTSSGGSAGGGLLSSIFGGGTGGGGGLFSSLIGAFATEGQFQVGGTGGMDSQIVPVRASPGEVVSVTHGQPTEAQAQQGQRNNRPNIINMTVQTADVHSFNRSQAQVYGRLRRGINAAGRNA